MLVLWRLFGLLMRESRCFSWRCVPRPCEFRIAGPCMAPHDRVRGRRGLVLALMGAATSLCSGNGGGFAALEASPRRVAGVSRL